MQLHQHTEASRPRPLRNVGWVRVHVFDDKISDATVYRMARLGQLPSVSIGRRVLFDELALRRFIEAGGKRNGEPP